jgi:hypothetical protein
MFAIDIFSKLFAQRIAVGPVTIRVSDVRDLARR